MVLDTTANFQRAAEFTVLFDRQTIDMIQSIRPDYSQMTEN